MNHGLKALLLAASTIITCIIVGLGFRMAEEAKRLGNHVVEELYAYRIAIEEQDIMKYDGVTVYGTDVVNLMKAELPEKENGFFVTVINGSYEYRYGEKSSMKKVQEPGEPEYLAPTAEYMGEVIRNENDVITEVIFRKKQQGG